MRKRQRIEHRAHALPLIYGVILVGEIATLATLVVHFGTHAPYRYELGWAGLGSFAAMQLYSIRRRIGAARHLGSLDGWLDLHVFLGVQGFVLVIYHGIGLVPALDIATFDAGLVVALVITGLIGRYVFRRFARVRTQAVWSLLHRPLAFLLLSLTTLHVLAHYAYAR